MNGASMMLPKGRAADSQGWRDSFLPAAASDDPKRTRADLTRAALLGLLAVLVGPLARPWLGQWLAALVAALGNVCILGGILAAPVVSMVAWVGMVLPGKALLHQIAPALMTTALIWLAAAIVGAHVVRLRRRATR